MIADLLYILSLNFPAEALAGRHTFDWKLRVGFPLNLWEGKALDLEGDYTSYTQSMTKQSHSDASFKEKRTENSP